MTDTPAPDPPWSPESAAAWLEALAAEIGEGVGGAATSLDPAAEAITLRRWLAAAGGGIPPATLLRLRREIDGARLHLGGRLSLVVCGGARTAELARVRFGAAPRMMAATAPQAALAGAAASPAVAAVIALDATPWWGRLLAQPALRVFARLPALGPAAALAVGRVETAPSGGDETFFATDAPGPADHIEAALSALGLPADLVAQAGGLKLFALAGYVQADDGRLARAPGRLTGVIGAAPTGLP